MRIASMAAAAVATFALASMSSAVTVTNFDNFSTTERYGSWQTGTVTSGPTALRIQATGYGSAYNDIADVNAAGTNTIQLNASVASGTAGFLITLGDGAGRERTYAWYGNGPGDYVLTKSLSTPNGSNAVFGPLDVSNIIFIHTQIDPGGGAVSYDASFNDLQLITIPEPTTLAALALAGVVGIRRRR